MVIYTIGFTKKKAEHFFEPLKQNGIQLLVDVRLNNKSQLAGFTKDGDIQYFLDKICGVKYVHCDEFAPTKELLKSYQDGNTSWEEYEVVFHEIMCKRGCIQKFTQRFSDFERICLLCSEATPDHCHRRLVAEMISDQEEGINIVHL